MSLEGFIPDEFAYLKGGEYTEPNFSEIFKGFKDAAAKISDEKKRFYKTLWNSKQIQDILKKPWEVFIDHGLTTYVIVGEERLSAPQTNPDEKLVALSVVACQELGMEPYVDRLCLDICGSLRRIFHPRSGNKKRTGAICDVAEGIRRYLETKNVKVPNEKTLERYAKFIVVYGLSTKILTENDANEFIKKVQERKERNYVNKVDKDAREILQEIIGEKAYEITRHGDNGQKFY